MSAYLAKLAQWWSSMSPADVIWLSIGMAGNSMFVLRWLIQWLASEKAQRMVVPEIFWSCSLAGGLMVLAYGLSKPDPVIIMGQFGIFIYARNIYFLHRQKRSGRPMPPDGT